jgi:hypothetical protein
VAVPLVELSFAGKWIDRTNRAAANGMTAYVFDVDPASLGGPFAVESVDSAAAADIDISFFGPGGAGDTKDISDDERRFLPVNRWAEHIARVTGSTTSKRGFVPEGARYGLVWLHKGLDVDFIYEASAPTHVSLSGDSLDVTISAGGAVRWTNDTSEEARVTSGGDEYGDSAFDSGVLPVGTSFSVAFPYWGTYRYGVGARAGTVTVRP